MKTIYHVPTEQYGFLEIEIEEGKDIPQVSINDRIEQYRAISGAVKGGEGMTEKELDLWVENMLLGKGNEADVYTRATKEQQIQLHRVKRALNRIKSRNEID